MIPASLEQKAFIDLHRGRECHHPPARELEPLEFLSCKRCGMNFVDGVVRLQPVQLEADDPPGERHNSSYAGHPIRQTVAVHELTEHEQARFRECLQWLHAQERIDEPDIYRARLNEAKARWPDVADKIGF